MGKMKGNRLNTAANVGSFITGRQQLNVQRTLAQQNAVQAELAAVQLTELRRQQLTTEHQRVRQCADTEVAAGRLSADEAENHVAMHMYNLTTPAPQPSDRITAKFSELVIAGLNAGGAWDGWYKQGDGTARYWDGNVWTHHTTSVEVARKLVQQLAAESYSGVRTVIESAPVAEPEPAHHVEAVAVESPEIAAQPPLPPEGWYPIGRPGVLGYWNGKSWTGETRPDPKDFPG